MAPEPTGWRLLCTFATEFEADMAKGLLESCGIPAHTASESVARLYGITSGAMEVRVFVPAAALEEAKRVLESEAQPDAQEGHAPEDLDRAP